MLSLSLPLRVCVCVLGPMSYLFYGFSCMNQINGTEKMKKYVCLCVTIIVLAHSHNAPGRHHILLITAA